MQCQCMQESMYAGLLGTLTLCPRLGKHQATSLFPTHIIIVIYTVNNIFEMTLRVERNMFIMDIICWFFSKGSCQ